MTRKTFQSLLLVLSLQLTHSLTITGTIRDFHVSHPDFEKFLGDEKGIVEDQLGVDGKPVYKGGHGLTTTGKADFSQWYNDVPGVNEKTTITFDLTDNGNGIYSYSNFAFSQLTTSSLEMKDILIIITLLLKSTRNLPMKLDRRSLLLEMMMCGSLLINSL